MMMAPLTGLREEETLTNPSSRGGQEGGGGAGALPADVVLDNSRPAPASWIGGLHK